MKLNEFIEEVKRTMPPEGGLIPVLGLVTESAEIADIFKRYLKYKEIPDFNHLKEEIGDVLNYLVQLTTDAGIDLNECMEMNIRKMQVRYPNGFSAEAAINRDVEAEKKAMSGQ